MNQQRTARVLISVIAAHSLLLGTAMMLGPEWTLRLGGWAYEGPLFFPAQSGVFLIILGGAYLAALRDLSFAWLLVGSKAAAVLFLSGSFILGVAPASVLAAAAIDGIMGLSVVWAVLWHPVKFAAAKDDNNDVQLTAETFQQVARALALAPTDIHRRRTSRRMALKARVTAVRSEPAPNGDAMLEIHVTDASPNGLGFVCDSPLEPGAELMIPLPSGTRPLTLRCQVMRCDQQPNGNFRIGGRFTACEAA